MVNDLVPSVFSKTYVTPRRPYEKAHLDLELKIIREYGLHDKKEMRRVKYTLFEIRKAARDLLTLEEKESKSLFEGAKSIHCARVLIRQRCIRVRKQVVNIPSFTVRLDSQKHIDFSLKSPFGDGRPRRVRRKNLRKGTGGGAAEEEED